MTIYQEKIDQACQLLSEIDLAAPRPLRERYLQLCPQPSMSTVHRNSLGSVAFQLHWQAQDPAADCDANGEFDVLDFVCFQQLFVEGCD